MRKFILINSILFATIGCTHKEKADLLVYNATVYTIDSAFTTAEALVITNGKIVATGTSKELKERYNAEELVNAGGKFIYPGFIDAHAHFVGYGKSLQTVNLVGTASWKEVTDRVIDFTGKQTIQKGDWISGRGWDQNDWKIKRFPDKQMLDQLFPANPVILSRIDGHAAVANQQALDIAGIKANDKIAGGEIETKNGVLTGILIDNAVHLVSRKIPEYSPARLKKALLEAQQNCFAVGLTTVDDCGIDFEQVLFIDSLQKKDELLLRIYAMLSDSLKNFDFAFSTGKIKTDRLNVRAFKVYADGALGSRGACLLEPYHDKPGWSGFLLSPPQHFDSVANILLQQGFQMCTHAIGDSGNRAVLSVYEKYLPGKNDLRWRIEHAQVINENDFIRFANHSIIPSVQPTHATSDMYWAGDRLGSERVKGAYAYKQLMEQNGWLPLGTDFPVEDISPLKTFYAAVIRKDVKGWPANGYQADNALTRQQALRGMTIWAARSNFEENEKGSLEPGKMADFVIVDKDLLREIPEKLLEIKVLKTYIDGKKVYERN
jgi:predicted amidohydrolase YtcJ